jgi:uncharacterized protein with GYD domain
MLGGKLGGSGATVIEIEIGGTQSSNPVSSSGESCKPGSLIGCGMTGRNRRNPQPDHASSKGRSNMPLYMYQAAYTPESWAAQLKNPQNRIETVGRQACEAVGGKLVGGWYCFGEYDAVFICDVPDNESMSAIALAVAAGGAIKAAKTTVLMTGTEGVGGMKKADAVAKTYKPAR